jgi:hypothetical protein
VTLRRSTPDGNLPRGEKSDTPPVNQNNQPLLSQRAALILISALVIAVAAGILAYLAGGRPAQDILAGGAALAAAITLLNALIG